MVRNELKFSDVLTTNTPATLYVRGEAKEKEEEEEEKAD